MLGYWISVAFLVLLLIPVGLFMISLVYFTGQEMRNHKKVKTVRNTRKKKNQPQRRSLRVVK
ncbi:hypothetical protein [Alkaliphilus crotonatoxidans]